MQTLSVVKAKEYDMTEIRHTVIAAFPPRWDFLN